MKRQKESLESLDCNRVVAVLTEDRILFQGEIVGKRAPRPRFL